MTSTNKQGIFNGRYSNSSEWLIKWFAEDEYIKIRYQVECAWIDTLCEQLPQYMKADSNMPQVPDDYNLKLDKVRTGCDVSLIRELERETKNDVKAIVLYLKERLSKQGDGIPLEWVHMCITSQDVNSLAQSIILSNALFTLTTTTRDNLNQFLETINVPTNGWCCEMLNSTHLTTLNHELCNHMTRIYTTLNNLDKMELTYKFGGAVGNWAAGTYTFPEISADEWNTRFFMNVCHPRKYPVVSEVRFLGLRQLTRSVNTTQTDDYSSYYRILNELCLLMQQIQAFAADILSLNYCNYLKLRLPIHLLHVKDFTELAISVLRSIADKIMIGEYQRDMSKSTDLRSLSTAFGYIAIVINELRNGLNEIYPNQIYMKTKLVRHPEVIMEAVQTVCRRYNITGAYEQAKDFVNRKRKLPLTLEEIRNEFIDKIEGLPDKARSRLLELNPDDYLG